MIKQTSTFLALCFLVQSSHSLAASSAKVLMSRGEVTKLLPGDHKASAVKRGEVLPEDTSVLTGEKSVVRLEFSDKSTMNLGPRSKVVISKMSERKPNMINLLTGAIKAEVDKKENKEKENKMIVKTRSAVMGIRGTKFQAVYNPQNNNTSLVTVEGKVAMAKSEKPLAIKESSQQAFKVASSDQELDSLDKTLRESRDVVEVDAGKFSGVQESKTAPSQPVKIAPKQYEAIAKSMNSEKTAEEVMETKDAQAEVESLQKGAPRPGGFVDFQTGIYVPPAEEAALDQETATFTSEDMGNVDATGDYIPPKGVRLDAEKGFVIDQEEMEKVASSDEKVQMQRTLAKMEAVNKEVKKQIASNKSEAKIEAAKPWHTPDSHELQVEVVPYSEVLALEDTDGDDEFYSESASDVIFTWKQNWNERFSTSVRVGSVDYSFEESAGADFMHEDGSDEEYFSIGAAYAPSEKWSFSADFVSKTMFFWVPGEGGENVEIVSDSFDYLSLGAKYFLLDWKKLAVFVSGNILVFGEDTLHTMESEEKIESYGLKGALEGVYSFSENTGLTGNLFVQRIQHNVVSAHGDAAFNRTSLGTGLNFFWRL